MASDGSASASLLLSFFAIVVRCSAVSRVDAKLYTILLGFADQPPWKQKLWLIQADFGHCNSHAQMVLPGGCTFSCSKCYYTMQKQFFDGMVHTHEYPWILMYLSSPSLCDILLVAPRTKIAAMRIQPGQSFFTFRYMVCAVL